MSTTVELLKTTAKVGSALLKTHAGKLSEVIRPIFGEGAQVLSDAAVGILDPSSGNGQQAKGILEALGGFKESLNGQATKAGHEFLQSILDGNTPLNRETLEKVLELAEGVERLPIHDASGQGLLFDVEEEAKPNASSSESQSPDLAKLKQQAFEEGKKAGRKELEDKVEVVPDDPMKKILFGVAQIFKGEIENGSSELGLLMRGIAWWKGEKLDHETIKKYVNGFAGSDMGSAFEGYIKARFKGEEYSLDGLPKSQAALIKTGGVLVSLASKIPPSWMDKFAQFGLALDWSAELLQRVPFGGFILKIPGVRKLLTDGAAFIGRFKGSLETIHKGVTGLKSDSK